MLATPTNFPTTRPGLGHARPRAAASSVAENACRRRSLYEVLRVKHDASPVEIKAAYRTLAKLYHPDSKARFEAAAYNGGSRDFIEVREAYGTLSDAHARAAYDRTLKPGSGQGIGIYPTRRWETDQCW